MVLVPTRSHRHCMVAPQFDLVGCQLWLLILGQELLLGLIVSSGCVGRLHGLLWDLQSHLRCGLLFEVAVNFNMLEGDLVRTLDGGLASAHPTLGIGVIGGVEDGAGLRGFSRLG